VLKALAPHREAPRVSDEHAPVRVCHRYLAGREQHLKYREAPAEGLPIGSGEIERAHRHVAQKRLKLPGAWRLVEHAEYLLGRARRQPARPRQSQPPQRLTRRLIPQLWCVPPEILRSLVYAPRPTSPAPCARGPPVQGLGATGGAGAGAA
jgi:hypothetical protein